MDSISTGIGCGGRLSRGAPIETRLRSPRSCLGRPLRREVCRLSSEWTTNLCTNTCSIGGQARHDPSHSSAHAPQNVRVYWSIECKRCGKRFNPKPTKGAEGLHLVFGSTSHGLRPG